MYINTNIFLNKRLEKLSLLDQRYHSKAIMLNISKVFVIVAVLSRVYSEPTRGWREISIHLRRSIGSATSAAEKLHVTYVSMLKAYEKLNTGVDRDQYWVSFIADSMEGVRQECQAYVLWLFTPNFKRIVTGATCKPIPEPAY
ncbi:uncharacterized protein LOC128550424 [Mercenaria mercenaria]|uniref:uncharacterized protein LOC128550424 n=1 Tax=Mercenaria mercenaria TaxID=6596 RepID=UPI00234EFF0F|nr:uncharacterized protein LOC128550424 [Mercenaria mercenaria]